MIEYLSASLALVGPGQIAMVNVVLAGDDAAALAFAARTSPPPRQRAVHPGLAGTAAPPQPAGSWGN